MPKEPGRLGLKHEEWALWLIPGGAFEHLPNYAADLPQHSEMSTGFPPPAPCYDVGSELFDERTNRCGLGTMLSREIPEMAQNRYPLIHAAGSVLLGVHPFHVMLDL